jgi:hypothetical protein
MLPREMASIAFHLMRRIAGWRRARFVSHLPDMARLQEGVGAEVPTTLLAFCGKRDLPEQVASWRSFHRWVGRPRRAVLVSDGTLGEPEKHLLRTLEPRVEIVSLESFGHSLATERMLRYAEAIPMGRKLLVMRSLDSVSPCLYADSDILYFPAARELSSPGFWGGTAPSYLLDPYPSLDLRLLQDESERLLPVNAGFLVLRSRLDWGEPLARLERLVGDPVFFTEQTLVHLAVRAGQGKPLDPDRFVLRIEDQWAARDRYAGAEVALRHYVSHIRYKMWMRVPLRPGRP